MGEANESYYESKKKETIVNHLKYKHFYMSVIQIIKAKGKKRKKANAATGIEPPTLRLRGKRFTE